ncbi:MAG: methionine gamma-lyase family protein [Symbiobacteriaceae bacterium]|nr:methionine gamma-lyase family protein [Symbiobacteriaceae bacterium]
MAASVRDIIRACEKGLAADYRRIEEIALHNQEKVLQALWQARLGDHHFKGSTGYGYDDLGRETLDKVYAAVCGAEAALVRSQFVSGTHAIGAALFGNLRSGDELISASGTPYDTLRALIGNIEDPAPGTLRDMGISYREVPLTSSGELDLPACLAAISPATKMLLLQRSRGYSWRPALSIAVLTDFISKIKAEYPQLIVFVDNCYGEFVEGEEPSQVGADLMAGSLIKNPGGGLALGGGYIVGRAALIAKAAQRLTMPGLGSHMGATAGEWLRLAFQGLYLAPHVVGQALKGMHLWAAVLATLGFQVSPPPHGARADIIQAVRLDSREQLLALAVAVQRAAPVDAHLTPLPWHMPGYEDEIIMAAGAFIQGSSLELSMDAPLREPYTAYLQGGLTLEHSHIALEKVLSNLKKT